MSKIVFTIDGGIDPGNLMRLKAITSASINDIKRSIDDRSPISEYLLFYNNHDEIAQNLRDLVDFFTSHSISAKFFELNEDENYRTISNPSEYEISSETLINILDQHDQAHIPGFLESQKFLKRNHQDFSHLRVFNSSEI